MICLVRDASAQIKGTRLNAGSTVLTLFCKVDCMGKEKTEGEGERDKEGESVEAEAGHHGWIQPCLVGPSSPWAWDWGAGPGLFIC